MLLSILWKMACRAISGCRLLLHIGLATMMFQNQTSKDCTNRNLFSDFFERFNQNSNQMIYDPFQDTTVAKSECSCTTLMMRQFVRETHGHFQTDFELHLKSYQTAVFSMLVDLTSSSGGPRNMLLHVFHLYKFQKSYFVIITIVQIHATSIRNFGIRTVQKSR